jgi:neural Wiskott-Aldrich syndrome protein
MNGDPNKKSPRTFQCRDALWDKFEQMARELECSVDYLINDAMKQYARQRNYVSSGTGSAVGAAANAFGAPRDDGRMGGGPGGSYPPPPPSVPPRMPPLPPPGQQMQTGGRPFAPPGQARSVPPPPTTNRGGAARPIPAPPPSRAGSNYPPATGTQRSNGFAAPAARQQPVSAQQQQGMQQHGGGMQHGMQQQQHGGGMQQQGYAQPAMTGLTVIYNGERVGVTKDRFVIGRGKQSSDLTLKDPNVSRQHAMIEFQNGAYFMVDMGSTNGVEYNGQRVARKQIAEGDIFRICDHDLRFTYR